jgi:guanine deaminase
MVEKSHILLLEPNAVTRKLIAGILAGQGYGTFEAENGDAAVHFLAKNPAVALVDVDQGDDSITGFLHKLRAQHERLPLIAMTDSEDRAALEAKLGIKHLSFLEKPVLPDRLLQNIAAHLVGGIEKEIASHLPSSAPAMAPASAQEDELRAAHMRRALDLAQMNVEEGKDAPFAAVVARAGKILGEGRDTVLSSGDPTARAEINALRAAARALGTPDLSGCALYSSCEPCAMGLSAAYWAHVDRVFYASTRDESAAAGFDSEYVFREMAQPEHKRALPSKMMLHDEGNVVLTAFANSGIKLSY